MESVMILSVLKIPVSVSTEKTSLVSLKTALLATMEDSLLRPVELVFISVRKYVRTFLTVLKLLPHLEKALK